jgi:hypothetical protein
VREHGDRTVQLRRCCHPESTPTATGGDAWRMSNLDFDEALAPLEPKNTARLTLHGVKVNSTADVVLIGKHAGALNERFQSLAAKLAKKHAAVLTGEDNAARRALSNGLLAEVQAKTVITGWENVCDREKKPLPFTVEKCTEFLSALQKKRPDIAGPGGAVDCFFSNPTNFADGYTGDVDELGK